MNNRSLIKNASLNTHDDTLSKVEKYLQNKGWKTSREVKLRGKIADFVAVKDKEIAVIEVKGESGDIEKGIGVALHYKNAANYSYLCVPKERLTGRLAGTCKSLGVGLLVANKEIKELVRPARSEALSSVKEIIFGKREKGEEKKIGLTSSLDRLFRSKSQILILKLFFLNATSEFHLHEIARRTDLAPSTVVKEMRLLYDMGIVMKRSQGNLVFYKINKNNTIFDELRRIFLKYEMLDQIIAEELPAKKIKFALIYGSFAKGSETESSDIDLLTIGEVSEDKILDAMMKIEGMTGREINYILWTTKEFERKVRDGLLLLRNIAENPIIMIIGDENEFRQIITK